MLAMSVHIIMKNPRLYLSVALLVIVLETIRGLGFFRQITDAGMLLVYAYFGSNLTLIILRSISFTGAPNYKWYGRLAAGLKVALIFSVLFVVKDYLFFKIEMSKEPGAFITASYYFARIGVQVLVVPAVFTLLGSWVPAGIVGKDASFVSAVGRGVMSVHTVYWRLVLFFSVTFLLEVIVNIVYAFTIAKVPFLTTASGDMSVPGLAYWYLHRCLLILSGMVLLTYVNVVVCICYLRFEKIDLDEASQVPTTA